MKLAELTPDLNGEAIDIYVASFTSSEGEQEGNIIGGLVSSMLDAKGDDDLFGFAAFDGSKMIACILFSKFMFLKKPDYRAFILSPVAVHPNYQRQGVGKKLIEFGLNALKANHIELALTYGDPAYYTQLGFEKITVDQIPAPQPLSQPIGWLAQSLTSKSIPVMNGKTRCVKALNHPDYW